MFQRVGGCSSSQSLGLTEVLLTNSWAARTGRGLTLGKYHRETRDIDTFLIPIILYNYIDCVQSDARPSRRESRRFPRRRVSKTSWTRSNREASRVIANDNDGPRRNLILRHRQSQLALSEHLITYFRSLILSLSFISIPQSHSHTSPRSALLGGSHAPHPFTITMR